MGFSLSVSKLYYFICIIIIEDWTSWIINKIEVRFLLVVALKIYVDVNSSWLQQSINGMINLT